MKTRSVEYFRLWDDHTWDTEFIDIPAETPVDRLENAIREAVRLIDWDLDVPIAVGLYHGGDEADAELTAEQRESVALALGYIPDEPTIINAIDEHEGDATAILKAVLHEKEAEFEAQGGRGVQLAEEIDRIRIALALRD